MGGSSSKNKKTSTHIDSQRDVRSQSSLKATFSSNKNASNSTTNSILVPSVRAVSSPRKSVTSNYPTTIGQRASADAISVGKCAVNNKSSYSDNRDATRSPANFNRRENSSHLTTKSIPAPSSRAVSSRSDSVATDIASTIVEKARKDVYSVDTKCVNKNLPSFHTPSYRTETITSKCSTDTANKNVSYPDNRNVTPISSNRTSRTDTVTSTGSVDTTNNNSSYSQSDEHNTKNVATSRSRLSKKNTNFSRDPSNSRSNTSIHDIFMKRLIGGFNLKYSHIKRGFICDLCQTYTVFHNKHKIANHNASSIHCKNMAESTLSGCVKCHFCKSCKAEFYGDVNFWIAHINSELHVAFKNVSCQSYEKDKERGNRTEVDVKRLVENVDIDSLPVMSFSDVLNGVDRCEDSSEPAGEVILNNLNCDDRECALVMINLPSRVTRGDVFKYCKDFGVIDDIIMNFMGRCTAKVFFKYSFTAKNIVENNIPVQFNGQYPKLSISFEE